jgi:hypothetical protein
VVTQGGRLRGGAIERLDNRIITSDGGARDVMAALDCVRARGGETRVDFPTLVGEQEVVGCRSEEGMHKRHALLGQLQDLCVACRPQLGVGHTRAQQQIRRRPQRRGGDCHRAPGVRIERLEPQLERTWKGRSRARHSVGGLLSREL